MVKFQRKKYYWVLLVLVSSFLCKCTTGVVFPRGTEGALTKCSGNGVPSYFLDDNSEKRMECICTIGFVGEQCRKQQDLGEVLNSARDGDEKAIKSYWHKKSIDPNSDIAGKILRIAASNNKYRIVELVIGFGVDVNIVNGASWDDYEGLHLENIVIASETDGEVTRDGGAWEKRLKEEGLTALMMACKYGHKTTVEMLLGKGALVNKRSLNGRSALMFAAASGNEKILDLIVNEGANVFDRDLNGDTALMYSITGRNRRVIEMLISLGDDPDRKNAYGISLMDFIEEQGDVELKEYVSSVKKRE